MRLSRLRRHHPRTTLVSLEVAVQPSHPVGLAKLYLQRLRAALRSNLDNLREALAKRENR